MILRIKAFRAIAILTTLSAAATVLPGSALAAASKTVITPRSESAALTRPGALAGIVDDRRGKALAGVCVTASPAPAPGRQAGSSRTVVTSAGGMFIIAGLPAGSYLLRYRRCLTSAGMIAGSASAPVTSSRGYVTGGRMTMLGSVTVRPLGRGQVAAVPARPTATRLTAAQARRRLGGPNPGGIAGRVRGPRGRHIKGLCFNVFFRDGFFGASIGADGHYSTGKTVPPGTYTVGFTTACGASFLTASANWATEWYREKFSQSAANTVVVKAGKITRGIGGVMRRGGVISGVVTGNAGRGLAGICVVAASPNGTVVQQITTPRNGEYRFRGLDPGRYGIGFFPNCGQSGGYLPQWWPGRSQETKRGLIRTGFGTARGHVDARLVLGGTISGVVKLRNRHGRPIKGICVDATPASNPSGFFDILAASNAQGKYAIRGLTAGRYSLSFFPGCDNNGNYLSQNYPHAVTARLAHVTGGINAYLQPGAIVTGTVTAKSTGAPLGGICAATSDGSSVAVTGARGNYSLNQIPSGTVQVQFFNCANRGNFAPQNSKFFSVRSGRVVSGIDAALAAGATISGTMTLASGRKLSNVCVDAIPTGSSADLFGGEAVSQRGRYVIENLPPGLYQVLYTSCGGPNIADAWFARPGHVTADENLADQIDVPAARQVPAIDAVLQLGGSISGWAFGPKNQQGSDVCMTISNAKTGVVGFFNGFFDVNIGGGYTVWGFAPARYLVEFYPCSGENLAVQWYKRASRPGQATPVLVRAGHTTSNVDAWMTTGGSITGRVVSKTTGKPLARVCVQTLSLNQPFFGIGVTNRSGKYVVTGLNSSTYRLSFISCDTSRRLLPLVTRGVRATAGKTVIAPAVAMGTYRAGAISGRVAIAGSPRKAANRVCVDVFPFDRGAAGSLETVFGSAGPGGRYRITGLVPGKYKVLIGEPDCTGPEDLVPLWYLSASRRSKATVVLVAAGRTTRLARVTLQRNGVGSISGTVTGPKPAKKALAGICVQVTPVAPGATPFLAESAAPNGGYLIGQIPPGRYLVEFEAGCAARGYKTQWWKGAAHKSGATPVTVRAGRASSGISGSLTPG